MMAGFDEVIYMLQALTVEICIRTRRLQNVCHLAQDINAGEMVQEGTQ